MPPVSVTTAAATANSGVQAAVVRPDEDVSRLQALRLAKVADRGGVSGTAGGFIPCRVGGIAPGAYLAGPDIHGYHSRQRVLISSPSMRLN
jgi:hypothetical protein